jgi:two-component system, OmpR family, KDP operon response regulator KdpE
MNEPAQSAKPVVLVVDDEPQIRRLLTLALEGSGYRVETAETAALALSHVALHPPALVVLDLGLPDLPGIDVLRRMREWTHIPVIILTANDAENEKVSALDEGADDYVTKPFNTAELLARVRVALRHAERREEAPVHHIGPLVIDLASRRVTKDGADVSLTSTEYSLLRLLVRHAGKVLTHRQILREVWGPAAENQTHYLRVYVARLREKLEPDPERAQMLITEPGVGYRFKAAQ